MALRQIRMDWSAFAAAGLAFAAMGLLPACGDDATDSGTIDTFEVRLVSPAEDAVVFAGAPTSFVAEALETSSPLRWEWTFGERTVQTTEAPSTEHTFASPGTYAMRVRARASSGSRITGEGEVQRQLAVLRPVDLTVASAVVTSSVTTVGPADRFRVTYDVINLGGEGPLASETGIFAAPSDALASDAVVDRATFTSLRSAGRLVELVREPVASYGGQGAQVSRDLASVGFPETTPNGEYTILVMPDIDGALADAQPANDGRTAARRLTYAPRAADGADLIVGDVTARPTRVNRITEVRVSAVVSNLGNQPALTTSWEAWLSYADRARTEDDILLGGGEIAAVVPGAPVTIEERVFAVEPAATALGEYFVILVVNPDGAQPESNLENNEGVSPRIVVTDQPVPGVDISVESFEIAPRLTFINGSIETTLRVANLGTASTNVPFFCRLYLSEDATLNSGSGGDRAIDTISLPVLAADEEVEVTRVTRISPILTPGDWFAFVLCDPAQTIAESELDNNVAQLDGQLRISTEANVNLVVESASVTPADVENGDEVEVLVRICNEGSNGSTPSTLRVHISRDADFAPTDTVLFQSRVPPLEPGACLDVGAPAPAICDTFTGTYTVFAVADALNEVPELDESDNVFRLPDPLVIRGLVCACVEDRFEPNNTITTAGVLNPAIRRFDDLTMCTANVDWYRVPLLRSETIRAAISFENARGNLDLTLFGPDRSTELAASRTNGNREEVSFFVVPTAGDYYLRVQGRTPQDRNVYSLELDVSARQPGTDLVALNVRATPENPVLGQTVRVSFDVVNLGTDPAGESLVRIYLTPTPSLDPLTAPRLAEVVIPTVTDRVTRTIDVALPIDATAGAAYLAVEVDARDQIAELNEDNNVAFSPQLQINGDCFDPFEPNNSLGAARELDLIGATPYQFTGLLVCSDNRDFYEVCVPDGSFLDWSVAFNPTDGDIDIRLYDELDRIIARSEGVSGTERVRQEFVNGERCFRLEVYVVGPNREVPYTMVVDTGPASDDLACSRIEEPNEDFGQAIELRNVLDDNLAICPVDDTDFYRVQLSAGTNVVFRLVPADGETAVPSQLRLALFNPSRAFITNTVSATEEIRHTVALTGSYFLRVRSNGAGPRNQRYRLEVAGVTGTDLVATELELEPALVVPGGQVRFSFLAANTLNVASPAAFYAVYLSTDPIRDASDRLLRELPLDPLPGLSERVEGRRVDIPDDLVDGGNFYLLVELDNRGQVTELSERNNVAAAPLVVAPRCIADDAEPNNFPFEAFALTRGDVLDLTMCPDDVDWFTFTPSANGPVRVRIEFTHARGDLDLYAFRNANAAPIAVSDTITDNEEVNVTGVAGEPLLFRVDSFYGDTNSYTLRIE